MSGFNYNEADTLGNESAYYEKFLLDDFENYLDEINDRLIVSRLVTDSVIKGIVNAIIDETAEKVASKETELASMKEKLQISDSNIAGAASLEPSTVVCEHPKLILDSLWTKSLLTQSHVYKSEHPYPEYLGRIKISVEDQVQRLKEDIDCVRNSNSCSLISLCPVKKGACKLFHARTDENLHSLNENVDYLRVMLVGIFDEINDVFCSMKISATEQRWKHEFHEEINTIVLQNFIRDIQEDCETKILEQRKLINALSKNYQQKVNELSSVREELDAISKSIVNSNQSLPLPHCNNENLEEMNNAKWKDQLHLKAIGNKHSLFLSHTGENGASLIQEHQELGKPVLEIVEFPHLKHLSKEDSAAYYKTEMTKMRRQHDKAMEEKTDELFKLKREFLKEKGSLLSKKDKELEHLKKNVRRIILNLDDILMETEMLVVDRGLDEFCCLKNKISSMFFDNQRLHGLLLRRKKEVEYISAQFTEVVSQNFLNTSVNKNLLQQISKLRGDNEYLNTKFAVKEELDAIILKEIIFQCNLKMEDTELETNFAHNICVFFVKEFASNTMSMMNAAILKIHAEKASIETILSEKEMALRTEMETSIKLQHEINFLTSLISEKEKSVFEARTTITQQKEQIDLVSQELDVLRDQVRKQRLIISGNKFHSEILSTQFDEALEQLHIYELEVNNLNQKLAVTSSSLEESERQKTILNKIIKKKEDKLSYSIIDGNDHEIKQVDAIMSSWNTLSDASINFENKLAGTIKKNESRLSVLSNQCSSLKQQVNLLLKNIFWYKRIIEIRNSNLHKAEAEVDLLGDEVDTLLSLLAKVYVALDHYSPVLQHYPGVMEILKLVQRELQGETTTSR